MSRFSRTRLQAGIFLAISLVVLAVAILLIGQKSSLFVPTRNYFVYYENASGLVPGAPVRLAGVDVGSVTSISLPEDPNKKATRIRIVVEERFAARIRADTLAFIDSKGLLGDKIINLTIGDPSQPEVPDDGTVKAGKTISFEALTADIQTALASVGRVAQEAEAFVAGLDGKKLGPSLTELTGSLARIMNAVEEGDGVVHRLIYDRALADQLEQVIAETRTSVVKIQSAVERAEAVVTEVQTGDGALHEVIYGQTGKELLVELKRAAAEIGDVTREIREGDGLLHTLVYGEGNTDFLVELNAFASSLRRMAEQIEKGRGTLGGLIVDPTVYEDLKTVLGNVERNVLFKALIRFTIENDQIRREPSQAEPAPHAPPPP